MRTVWLQYAKCGKASKQTAAVRVAYGCVMHHASPRCIQAPVTPSGGTGIRSTGIANVQISDKIVCGKELVANQWLSGCALLVRSQQGSSAVSLQTRHPDGGPAHDTHTHWERPTHAHGRHSNACTEEGTHFSPVLTRSSNMSLQVQKAWLLDHATARARRLIAI